MIDCFGVKVCAHNISLCSKKRVTVAGFAGRQIANGESYRIWNARITQQWKSCLSSCLFIINTDAEMTISCVQTGARHAYFGATSCLVCPPWLALVAFAELGLGQIQPRRVATQKAGNFGNSHQVREELIARSFNLTWFPKSHLVQSQDFTTDLR